MNYHCLFEQSGTFKNVLKSHGHNAWDYDLQNQFGETDFVIDLFFEIEKEYVNLIYNPIFPNETIFSNMKPEEDFIIAFFPCTHFCDANSLICRLQNAGGKQIAYDQKTVKRLIDRNQERARFFEIYLKFTYICQIKGIPTIIENPATSGGGSNYLKLYSPIDVGYYEKDRTLFGDKFKKPTNFYAINFDMKEKFTMFYDRNYKMQCIMNCKVDNIDRSLMTSTYAENFYKRFLERE